MSPTKLAAIALAQILLATQVRGEVKEVRIDAALYYYGFLVLINTEGQSMFLSNGKQAQISTVPALGGPKDFAVKAAFTTNAYDSGRTFFYGTESAYVYTSSTRKLKLLNYGKARRLIRDGGPDAVGRKDGNIYFFKGCQVFQRFAWNKWGRPANVEKLGLPCNPDAAWDTDEQMTMVILKGDQIWHWHADDTVEGPVDFSSKYTLTSWKLLPSEETK